MLQILFDPYPYIARKVAIKLQEYYFARSKYFTKYCRHISRMLIQYNKNVLNIIVIFQSCASYFFLLTKLTAHKINLVMLKKSHEQKLT